MTWNLKHPFTSRNPIATPRAAGDTFSHWHKAKVAGFCRTQRCHVGSRSGLWHLADLDVQWVCQVRDKISLQQIIFEGDKHNVAETIAPAKRIWQREQKLCFHFSIIYLFKSQVHNCDFMSSHMNNCMALPFLLALSRQQNDSHDITVFSKHGDVSRHLSP